MKRAAAVILAIPMLVGLAAIAFAAKNGTGPGERREDVEFQPARMIYRTVGGGGSRGYVNPWWAIDYPMAEMHFLPALNRLTRTSIAQDSRHLEVTDENLYDHPFLFLQQPGRGNWSPTAEEAKKLREYFDRGGFMLVDDFHGEYEWQIFADSLGMVFPDADAIDIPDSDSLMHVFYNLDSRVPIPGKRHLYGGLEGPSRWRGVYDERGRLKVGINFNIDMGDAWEHADDPEYPAEMTGQAYRLGVNYVIYAMTH